MAKKVASNVVQLHPVPDWMETPCVWQCGEEGDMNEKPLAVVKARPMTQEELEKSVTFLEADARELAMRYNDLLWVARSARVSQIYAAIVTVALVISLCFNFFG